MTVKERLLKIAAFIYAVVSSSWVAYLSVKSGYDAFTPQYWLLTLPVFPAIGYGIGSLTR